MDCFPAVGFSAIFSFAPIYQAKRNAQFRSSVFLRNQFKTGVHKCAVSFVHYGTKLPQKLEGETIYKVTYKNNKNAGTGKVTITMVDKTIATGSKTLTFKIAKAKNPMTVTAKKTVTAKANANTTLKDAIKVKQAQSKTYTVKITLTANGNSNYKSVKKTVSIKIKVK